MGSSNSTPYSRIIPIQIFNVRVFLIQTNLGYLLVDTGIPFQEKKLLRAFQRLDVKLGQIRAIFLTHGHLDHIGCLAFLQERTGASVICHSSLAATLAAGSYEEAVPRVWGWKLINRPVSKLLAHRLKPVAAQIIVDEALGLSEFGLNGSILHTPGHSPGSCSLQLQEGVFLIGDLLRERSPGKVDSGYFYHDRDRILSSLKKIASLEPELIYLSHGTTMTGKDLNDFLSRAADQEI